MSRVISRTLLVVISVALLVAVGVHVDGNHAGGLERQVFRALNSLPDAAYWPAWVIMQFGNMVVVPVAVVAALVLRRYRLAVALTLVGAGKWYASRFIKDWFLRERPAQILEDVIRRDAPAAGQAFVSGHAVIAVGLATVLHSHLNRTGRIVAWTIAALVCIARVYVGAHLPLDVIGGAAVGAAIGAIASMLVDGVAALRPSGHDSPSQLDHSSRHGTAPTR